MCPLFGASGLPQSPFGSGPFFAVEGRGVVAATVVVGGSVGVVVLGVGASVLAGSCFFVDDVGLVTTTFVTSTVALRVVTGGAAVRLALRRCLVLRDARLLVQVC